MKVGPVLACGLAAVLAVLALLALFPAALRTPEALLALASELAAFEDEQPEPGAGAAGPGAKLEAAGTSTGVSAEQYTRLHAKLDSDGDGRVSLQELLAHPEVVGKAAAARGIGEIFGGVDTSGDGKVSLEEHLATVEVERPTGDSLFARAYTEDVHREHVKLVHSRETAKFRAADADGDRLLSVEEMMGLRYPHTHPGVQRVAVAQELRDRDADGDGVLSSGEFWGLQGPGDTLSDQEKEAYAALDRNGDGSIDVEEMKAWESGRFEAERAARRLLAAADADSDLHLTSEEMAAAHQRLEGDEPAARLVADWVDHHEL